MFKLIKDGDTPNEFFFEYKHSDEPFGIGTLRKEQLLYGPFTKDLIIERHIPCWFDVGLNNDTPMNEIWNIDDRILYYIKLVYLTHEYLKNNKQFNNLICAYYNKIGNHWEVHPGVGRKLVYLLFGPPTIKCFILNNSNEHINYDIIFNSAEELANYIGKFHHVGVSPQMGSLIPDITYNDLNPLLDELELYQRKIQQFWQTHTLNHKVTLDIPINHNIDAEKSVNITVKNNNKYLLAKAIILAPIIFNNYQDDDIIITIQDNH